MDNMRIHHTNAVQAVLSASGVKVLFLPPFSLDLNPIERLWSKMKAILRHEKIRAADELSTAVARAFSYISCTYCSAWFRLVQFGALILGFAINMGGGVGYRDLFLSESRFSFLVELFIILCYTDKIR